MKTCPQCGKSEKEISMTTDAENPDDNRATCSCGWNGTYGAMGNPVKEESPKLTDREKLEASAKEIGIDLVEGVDVTDDDLKAAIKAKKTTLALVKAAGDLGVEIKEGTTDDEIKALIKAAKKEAAK